VLVIALPAMLVIVLVVLTARVTQGMRGITGFAVNVSVKHMVHFEMQHDSKRLKAGCFRKFSKGISAGCRR
jgi:hypothetical protein